ncbi:TonB-dependent receptor [Flavobacteriaceae bacterium]|nr:TonB-dependent receptor [Flavobacteriaceae bacterium]MDC1492010.1 TonB-dependent receptor [Flavobacteriaceae bacterium]MDC1534769.1 TonB-dependent receptor [Flavobacteriaceae bacterium]
MKILLLNLCLFIGTMFSTIQSQNISGNVKDSNSIPLVGVNVSVENSNNGAVTDFDGNFSLSNVSSDSNLVFSYLGFQTTSVAVGMQSNISVVLKDDLSELDEVVVIGYGSQKLSDISGAVSTVSSNAIEAIKPVRVEDALQGQASGINIISSGSPGSKPTVLIRGITSYAGNSPLVVIDGVSQSIDDLNSLNPSDIKSVSVLKDAALASIYGVKGGSGVIVVTTKSGERNSDTSFNFSTSIGNQSVVKMIDVLNASEYGAILNEASMAAGEGLIYPDLSGLGKGTNWQEEVINDAAIVNHSITASGGSDKTSFYVSAGYLGQDGVVGTSDKSFFNRTNFTTNINTDLTEKTKLLVNTNYTNIKGKGLPENGINSVLSNSLNFDPTVSPFQNGSFGISETITQEIINPLAQIDNTYNEGNTNKLTGKIELQHDLMDNLKVTSRFGYTFVDIYNKNFIPLAFYGAGHNATNANEDLSPIVSVDSEGTIVSTHNRISESKTNYFNYTFETYANYDFTINENHNFQTVLGFSIGENKGEYIGAFNEDVPFNSWAYADISAATGNASQQTSSSWQYVGRNVSYFSRLLYDFNEKYYFSFTGRVDGSTSFGANNKFGFFPSASLGWVVSKEDFFEDAPLDYLKFRASYGSLGNDNISPQFALISTFPSYTFDGSIINGSALGSVPNEDVSWENQVQMNLGIDTRLFDNKLSITVDYFKKTVDDLLFAPNLSLYLGTPSFPTTNIGKTQSTGIDASLSYNTTIGKDFNISTNLNFTTSDNEVLEINNGDRYIWGAGYGIPYTPIVRFEEGFSPGYFFGYKTDGIFQSQAEVNSHATQNGAAPGDIRFVDVNSDGIINDSDRTEIGDPFADFTIGWNLAVDYKNFDFSVFTYASVGNDIYRAYERNLNYTNRFASTLNRWTGAGTSNSEPRVSFIDSNNNRRASDRYIEDGSYLRIKNIQLGYTFPESFANQIGFDEIRAYTQVKNLLTLTEYSGYDPEISNGGVLNTGIDIGTYPQPRTWSMGLNIKF